jgi:hypothetical protein
MAERGTKRQKDLTARKNINMQPGEIAVPIDAHADDLFFERKNRVFIFSKDKVAPMRSSASPADSSE